MIFSHKVRIGSVGHMIAISALLIASVIYSHRGEDEFGLILVE
jgi:hypothetical protein